MMRSGSFNSEMASLDFSLDEDFAATDGTEDRPYQVECCAAIVAGWKENSRLLAVLATGCGKTRIFSRITQGEVAAGNRVLILAHTEELLEQAIDKLKAATGIEAEKEKADSKASPYAMVVVASIQTMSRDARLRGFAPDHFGLVICDETHRALAPSYQKVLRYFHFGAESLADNWLMPEPGMPYRPLARCLGVTATADRGDRRSLGEFYQACVYDFGLLEACREGWLVRPIVKSLPIKIDLRGIKTSRMGGQGDDFSTAEVAQRISPFLNSIADAIVQEAADKKTVCFLPSIETAEMMAEALGIRGLDASFVSGACPDREQKIATYHAAGPGTVICNAMLLIEGWDCPDISCVCNLRVTKIRSLYAQIVGRGTRTLPGLIDRLSTREARLAAIASSDKPTLTILDFLWLSDRLDLVNPVDLVATKPAIRELMMASGESDLLLAEAGATRDFLKNLEKAAKANAKKTARTLDPLAWAVSLGDAKLATWEPDSKWEEAPPTPGQLNFIRQQGMATDNIKFKGFASKIITTLIARMKLGLATPSQLNFMHTLGLPEQECAVLTIKQATSAIDQTIKAKRERDRAARQS